MKNDPVHFPAVLTIAGSDSGGGAGIQADLRTFHAFRVYGCSAVTAITAQNPDEVRGVAVLPPEMVKKQLSAILDVIPVRYAKTGMLANREIVECAAQFLQEHRLPLVVDPVMVSTSGVRLLEETAIAAMKEKLFPLAEWLTPNIPEAELICGRALKTSGDLACAAKMLYDRFRCNVILKGGHALHPDRAVDIVCCDGELFSLCSPRAAICGNTAHGTGCTLSSALAAALASGKDRVQAVTAAKAFVYGSLCEKAVLSDTLSQMYPPTEDRSAQICWQRFREE